MPQINRVSAVRRRVEGYVGAANGNDQPLSLPISATGLVAIAFVAGQITSAPSLVRNGQNFVLIKSEVSINVTIHSYKLVNPTVGTFDVVVTKDTFDRDLQVDIQVFDNVHLTNTIDSFASSATAYGSTPTSVAGTIPADGVLVGAISTRNDGNSGSGLDATVGSPAVISGNTDGQQKLTAAYLDASGSAAINFSWNPANTQILSKMGVVLTPAVAAAEETAPTLTGTLVPSNIGETGYTLTWPAASDNVGVVGYEYSTDAGTTWTAVGNVLTTNITGRTAGTTDQARVRAFDAAGNRSTALAQAVNLLAADITVPVMTGVITPSELTSTGYKLAWPAASDNVAVTGYEVSLDGGTSYSSVGNVLTTTITGRTPTSTDSVKVRAYDAKNNKSTPLSVSVVLPSSTDTTPPTFTGAIQESNKSSSGYTLTWPAATDNVAVVGYEVSKDNGSSYQAVGNVLTTNVTGRTPGATDQVKVRAFDAAGVRSAALSLAVTLNSLPTGSITTDILKNASNLPMANQAVTWTWTPAGRVGAKTGKTPTDGTGTTNNQGRLVIASILAGDGELDVAVWGADRTLDRVFKQYLTAV